MNLLDIALVMIFAFSLVAGYRRGFLLGAYEIAAAIAGLVVAIAGYSYLASVLMDVVPARAAIVNVLSFIAVYGLFQFVALWFRERVMKWIIRATGIVPGARLADRLLGIVPGAVQGLVLVGIVVLGLGFFPTSTLPGNTLEESNAGLRIYRTVTGTALEAASRAGFEFPEFYAIQPRTDSEGFVLPFEVDSSSLEVNASDEQRMLELINQERRARGLNPLAMDHSLVAVARAHSSDMFVNGYFSHVSPTTGDPFDRLTAAGIQYRIAGENLAFAPTVERAHEGLMDSPGHRANILEPRFERVGIAAIEGGRHGTMYTQVFHGG